MDILWRQTGSQSRFPYESHDSFENNLYMVNSTILLKAMILLKIICIWGIVWIMLEFLRLWVEDASPNEYPNCGFV